MEYTKKYPHIQFRITYSVKGHFPSTLSFAAEPYENVRESKTSENPGNYLLYGKVETEERLEVGFRPFTFTMTQNLHSRLGLLYEIVIREFRRVCNK